MNIIIMTRRRALLFYVILFCNIIPISNFHSPSSGSVHPPHFTLPGMDGQVQDPPVQPTRLSPSPLQELPFAWSTNNHYSEHLEHILFWACVKISFGYLFNLGTGLLNHKVTCI